MFAVTGLALADPSPSPAPATPTPIAQSPVIPSLPAIPGNLINNPYVQALINAVGGLAQTTNGPSAVGRVTYFKQFDMQLETAPSVYRKIRLHQGTIIEPRGTTIAPGMTLHVNGSAQSDGSLDADQITLR